MEYEKDGDTNCRVLLLMNEKTILMLELQKIKKFISLLGAEM